MGLLTHSCITGLYIGHPGDYSSTLYMSDRKYGSVYATGNNVSS